MKFFDFLRRHKSETNGSAESAESTASIDPETMEIAKMLAYEKRIRRASSKKWRAGRKSDDAVSSDEEIIEALGELKPSPRKIINVVFKRTVEDTVLSNSFMDSSGKEYRHLTVKHATGMDGLRDIDGDIPNAGVGVAAKAATPMNPEGRFAMPTLSTAKHDFANRFNEAMNPRMNGEFGAIPAQILEHYSKFATFIGYPLCELIATHPTVSNACSIPGEDAIAPGYKLAFIDSEDMDGDGYPDELEVVELGGVKRSLERMGAMEGLKNAIVALSSDNPYAESATAPGESLDALALALERLAAYEEWERDAGAGADSAQAVREGLITPVSEAFTGYVNNPGEKTRKDALAKLSLALADISKEEHPTLDSVRATNQRRGTVSAVETAIVTITRDPEGEGDVLWDSTKTLNDLAVAVERVAAYEAYSDRNAEVKAALSMALIALSTRITPESKGQAVDALTAAKAAMDEDDFTFADPNARSRGQVVQGSMEAGDPNAALAQYKMQEQTDANAQRLAELKMTGAEQRLAAAKTALEQKQRNAQEAYAQKLRNAQAVQDLKMQHATAAQEMKMKGLQAQQDIRTQMLQQQMENARAANDIKRQQAEMQMDAERNQQAIAQAQAEQQMEQERAAQEAQAQQATQAQQAAKEQKDKADKKREDTRLKAKIAKERQRQLDELKQRADDMGINKICEGLSRNARIFGIGIAVPVVEGADYERPFDIEKVREGSYKGFSLIEPTWIYPEVDSDDLVNPLSPSFFEPSYWAVTGANHIGGLAVRRIHRSWMIIVRHKEVPTMLRPMYYYGGLPLTQELYEAVFCADKVMNEVPKLAMTKRTTIVKGDVNDLLMNPEGAVGRLQAYSQVQDNFGILFTGRNTEVQKLETSLSEFDQLIAKCNQRVAAICQMPEAKLFKAQLAGLINAGTFEINDYNQLLINIQNRQYIPLLNIHFALDTKSRTGKVIRVKVKFNPIDNPTEEEKTQAESSRVQTINAATQGGWLAPSEARTLARSREESMFSSISAEMPEELDQAQQQGGGMPGMPQMGGVPGAGGDPMGGGMPPMGHAMGHGDPMGEPAQEPDEPKEAEEPTEAKESAEPKPPREPSNK